MFRMDRITGAKIFDSDQSDKRGIRADRCGVYLLKVVNKKAIAIGVLLLDAQSRIT